jgi:hypothetical protein
MTQSMKQAPRPRRVALFSGRLAALALGAAALGATVLGTSGAQARITRIEVKRVEQPTFEGRSFGTVGAYEKLVGRALARSIRTTRATPSSSTSPMRRRMRAAWSSTTWTS